MADNHYISLNSDMVAKQTQKLILKNITSNIVIILFTLQVAFHAAWITPDWSDKGIPTN